MLSLSLVGVSVAHAERFSALDGAYQSIPSAAIVTQVRDYHPVFDIADNSCYPSAAISRTGKQNSGLEPSGEEITSDCKQDQDHFWHFAVFNESNTYHRWVRQYNNGDEYSAHIYELYFEKDQAVPFVDLSSIGAGHRHDVESVIVYFKNQQPTHVAVSAHGNFKRKSWSEVRKHRGHPKIVYYKDADPLLDVEGLGTHAFMFADQDNAVNRWVTPPIVSWYEMSGDGVSNLDMREKFNDDSDGGDGDFGAASFKFTDSKVSGFKATVNKSDALPPGYPQFTDESIALAQWGDVPSITVVTDYLLLSD